MNGSGEVGVGWAHAASAGSGLAIAKMLLCTFLDDGLIYLH